MTHRTSLLVLVIAACSEDASVPSTIPAACNPLGGAGCLLPWPSLSYATPDPGTVTHYRLDLPIDAMPVNAGDTAFDPAPLNARWDGFSPTGPMLAMFPNGVSGGRPSRAR